MIDVDEHFDDMKKLQQQQQWHQLQENNGSVNDIPVANSATAINTKNENDNGHNDSDDSNAMIPCSITGTTTTNDHFLADWTAQDWNHQTQQPAQQPQQYSTTSDIVTKSTDNSDDDECNHNLMHNYNNSLNDANDTFVKTDSKNHVIEEEPSQPFDDNTNNGIIGDNYATDYDDNIQNTCNNNKSLKNHSYNENHDGDIEKPDQTQIEYGNNESFDETIVTLAITQTGSNISNNSSYNSNGNSKSTKYHFWTTKIQLLYLLLCIAMLIIIIMVITILYLQQQHKYRSNSLNNNYNNDNNASNSNEPPTFSPMAAPTAPFTMTSAPTPTKTWWWNDTFHNDTNNTNAPNNNNTNTSSTINDDDNNTKTNNSKCFQQQQQYPPIRPFPGKKGIGLSFHNNNYIANIPKLLQLDTYWNYDWGHLYIEKHQETSGINNSMYIPMVWWGGRSTDDFIRGLTIDTKIQQYIQDGSINYLLGFNEPDKTKQANMSVDKAIERWKVLQSLQLNVSLISPAPAHADGVWMKEFMHQALYVQCLRIDSIAIHWYGAPNFTHFQRYITSIHEMYNYIPITITEFAVADWSNYNNANDIQNNKYTKNDVLRFMKEALPWLEQTNWILGYAWFSFTSDSPEGWPSSLFLSTNERTNTSLPELTTIGQYYKSITNENPYGDLSITIV